MFRIVNREHSAILDTRSGVTLIGAETSVLGEARLFGGGASYTRPTRVEVANGRPIPITDHLMIVRLATAAIVVLATIWRMLK